MGLLAVLMLMPVTLPVAVLKGLVQERFQLGDLATSLFMVVNTVAAVLAAPWAGALADRMGKRRPLIVAALAVDAVMFCLLLLPMSYPMFLAVRFVEGAAHITALSLLLALAADAAGEQRRGQVMGMLGAGLTFGVALGAPIGGQLGRIDVLVPLRAAAVIAAISVPLAAWLLREAPMGARRSNVVQALKKVLSDRDVKIPLAFAFADRFTVGFFTTTFILMLGQLYGMEPARKGILLALFLMPFSLLSYPFGILAERTSRTLLVCGGSLVYGLFLGSLGIWSVGGLAYLMPILGLTSAVMFVPSLVMTVDLAPAGGRGAAMGAFNAAGSLGFIAGPLVGGFVTDQVKPLYGAEAAYTSAFAVAGATQIALVLVATGRLLKLRREGKTS